MTKESATSEASEFKPWESYPLDSYSTAIEHLIHHSFKTVNTNAESGGVRVGTSQGIKLPYVGVRTLIGHGIDVLMDRYTGAATSRIYSQIADVAKGRVDDVPLLEFGHIKRSLEIIKRSSFVQADKISPRVRQILLPRPDGGYISLTPLSSAGVSHQLKTAIVEHNLQLSELRKNKDGKAQAFKRITLADFPIGGAKPLNAGGLVFSMRAPIVGCFPARSSERSRVFSLHHNGIRNPRLPKGLQAQYVSWRNKCQGNVEANMEAREQHAKLISGFVRHLLRLGADAYELLTAYKDQLPGESLVSANVDAVSVGLIDPSQRTAKWKYQFSSWLSRHIATCESDEQRQHEYSQAEINLITGLVKGCL